MADAKHTPADDTSFRASLLRHGGGAVAVVAVSALFFWGIGTLGGGPSLPTVSDGEVAAPDDAEADDTEADDAGPEGPEPDAEEPDDTPTPEPSPDTDDTDEGEGTDGDDAGADRDDDADDADDDGEPAPDQDAIDPASISVQVLDGFKADGGTAAGGVADELSAAGYRVVARNQAVDYERTTVLYNAGQRPAAEQIARAIGAAEVREQPGNLSTAVDVHVVVGADRG